VPSTDLGRFLLGICLALGHLFALQQTWRAEAATAEYGSPQAIEETFKAGLESLESGDPETAIRIFRGILAHNSNLPRVRLELARAYFHAREWERSRREFFAVLSGDIPDTVRSRIIQFLRAIDARRGFDWNLSVALATSAQASRDYDTDTVMLDVLGVPLPFTVERDNDGTYGVQVRGSAEFRHNISGHGATAQVTGFGELQADIFEGNGGSADDRAIGANAGLRAIWPRTTASGSVSLSLREIGGEHFEDRAELRGALEWRHPDGVAVFGSGAIGLVDHHAAEFRDGTSMRARLGVARSIGGRSILGVALLAERLDADGAFESYTTLGGESFGSTDLGAGFDAAVRIFLLNQGFDARAPGFLERRDEWEYGFDIDLAKADLFVFGQFSPFVRAGFSRRDSSIDAFSYNEYRLDIGIRKAF